MEINLAPKNADFCCGPCDFKCCKRSEWSRHMRTAKHNYRLSGNNTENLEMTKNAEYVCKCGKKFLSNSGLWKHSNKCKVEDQHNDNSITNKEHKFKSINDKDLIMMLINDNKDFKQLILDVCKEKDEYKTLMMEVIKTGTHNTTNNTTNSHNKAFNLNFFLNETCKDAMNITEFVDSIKLQLSDLEKVGELGYVEGISSIIVKNLKNLDVTQRPVHCTDKKRETMYIKDEDKWEKDDEQKKMHKMVRKVADKNARMLPKFKEAHPDCIKSASLYSDQYNKIIMEAMGGRGDNDFEKEEKIIARVSKEVIVEKNPL
ncbi:MAG: hypothetical protein MUP82_07260 [Candidatus Marinimicrobia bacterium]|nr:hypothetical protein [Candidatus Neomarinimicrobiota bacterium]